MSVVHSDAAPIIFTYNATGTGSIGAASFSNEAFTITETADTAARSSYSDGFFIDDISATISINGVGNFLFTTPTRTFSSPNLGLVGFSRAGITGLDLLDGPKSSSFTTWNMLGSIGPISSLGNLVGWPSSPVTTDGGILLFNNSITTVTFQATLVPEPASIILILCGAAILILKRCQKGVSPGYCGTGRGRELAKGLT